MLTFGGFGVLALRVARGALEEELGRRLVAIARAAALAIRSERVDLLAPGDEESRTFRNVRRKLVELQGETGAARIYAFDAGRASRVFYLPERGSTRTDTSTIAPGFRFRAGLNTSLP